MESSITYLIKKKLKYLLYIVHGVKLYLRKNKKYFCSQISTYTKKIFSAYLQQLYDLIKMLTVL